MPGILKGNTQMLMIQPMNLVRPNHYVVVVPHGKGERVEFGAYLPLSKRAASQYAHAHVKGEFRLIMRKTAKREGILNFAV
jgi:hypothetical protein